MGCVVFQECLSCGRVSRAVEGYRSPKRYRAFRAARNRASVLDCGSPLPLCPENGRTAARCHTTETRPTCRPNAA